MRSALASASGSCDRYAPDSSAWYSRERDTAIWMTAAASGARIHAMRNAKGPNALSRSSLPPKKNANLAMNVMAMPMPAAIEPMRMSWFATCDSSWASTPRSSRSSQIWRIPFVAHTAAWCSLRPVAKAFGCAMSET